MFKNIRNDVIPCPHSFEQFDQLFHWLYTQSTGQQLCIHVSLSFVLPHNELHTGCLTIFLLRVRVPLPHLPLVGEHEAQLAQFDILKTKGKALFVLTIFKVRFLQNEKCWNFKNTRKHYAMEFTLFELYGFIYWV